ncbi:hypothetical protein AAF712_008360 [Marasmius tenuissimus]|uniref:Major facilitator superfamily (MFS) profile domain-containing protein n=1 Tax=Marasmius tenuissimus TaxID=585030 RepID=A0ABR2ZWL1_9AGAR
MSPVPKDISPPIGLKWRSGHWYVTFVVWLGIAVDLVAYSIVIPVLPFQLEAMGHNNVSSLTGYLLFAYSGGLLITTFPVAMLSERYNARQAPLVLGIFLLVGSLIMLMEAPVFWLMVLARVLQGVGSTFVWVVGLALLCDTAPEKVLGRQLGFAMSGLSIGILLGPPVGGALYERFGFRGPCIFVIIACILDLVARVIVIERKAALVWGHDPKSLGPSTQADPEAPTNQPGGEGETEQGNSSGIAVEPRVPEQTNEKPLAAPNEPASQIQLSFLQVLRALLTSPRAVATIFGIFVYGLIHTAIEPPLPAHMNMVWGFDSGKVGLVFIAAVVPTFFASAIAGYLTDRFGPAPIATAGFLLSVPWWILSTSRTLPAFIVGIALDFFFAASAFTPLSAELAEISRLIDGIGYAHVYAALNVAYGLGSTFGPVMGGQIFDHVQNGWNVLCYVGAGVVASAVIVEFFFLGERPMFKILRGWVGGRRLRSASAEDPTNPAQNS